MTTLQLAAVLALSCVAGLAWLGHAPYRDEFRTTTRRLAALGLWFGALAFIVFLPVASLDDGSAVDPSRIWFPNLFVGHAIICLFLLSWWKLRGDVSLARFLVLPRGRLGERIAQGVLVGITGWGLTLAVTGAAVSSFSEAATASTTELPEVMVWMATLPLPRKLLIILAAMTVEEGFFRAFLQPRVGLLMSSLLFALSHFSYGLPFLVVGVFTISLVLGATFARSRDLLPCIVAHGLFDAVQLLIVLPWAVHTWTPPA